MITYRKATKEDVRPALELALRVFMEFEAMDYEPEAVERFKEDIVNNDVAINNWETGKNLMYVASVDGRIVSVIGERYNNGHINILFVDGQYHRRGIASVLMNYIICDLKQRGFNRITLFSSPYGLPFINNMASLQPMLSNGKTDLYSHLWSTCLIKMKADHQQAGRIVI